MAKMSLEWHEHCADNAERSASQKRARLEQELDRLVRDEADVRFYRQQISEAKRRGMTAFDSDRLLVARKA